jgi:hypothetical protein
MENKVVNLQVNDNIDETTKSVVSLKTQLRQAQQEVAALSDKFGATSKEAVEAAKQAAILKDKIGDAKALTDAFNPDAKFNALSSSLGGVASGFAAYQGAMGLVGVESKDLEQQLLKVQSAMAIAQGLQGLGEARDSFKQLKAVGVNAFNAIKTAIGGTGIGLIVIAAGAIYAYWDDIKETVSSVSAEQKKLNELSKINLDTEEKKLNAIGSQDNVLKLQGKTEKDILKIKIAQTDQVIKASEIQIQQSIATSKAQTEAAIRNQEILSGILKFISIPLTLVLKTVDAVGKALGKDFGLESTVFKGLSSFVFDPIKTKKEGEAVVAEQRKALEKLKNDRAGLQLSINSIDKQANEAAKTEIDKKVTTQAEADKKALEEKKRILQEERDFMILLDDAAREKRVNDALEKEAYDAKVLSDATAVTDALMLEDEKRINSQKKAAEDLKKIEAEKLAVRMKALDDLTYIFGAESQLGKAFLIAKQLLLARELALEVTKTITFSTQAAARSAVAVAEGTAQTAKIGFPQNIPMLIGYAAQAVGIFGAIRSAVKSAKSSVSLPSMPSISEGGGASTVPLAVAPTFNVVGTSGQNQIAQSLGNQAPVKAYVVANDVSSQQSLDRNIVKTATLGN